MNILTATTDMGLTDFSVLAVLGYGVVFLGLIFLMIVVSLVGKLFAAKPKQEEVPVAAPVEEAPPAPVAEEVPAAPAPEAPGAAGQLKLHDVEPKTAAMLMAIVADKMDKPLNELHFISIKEVK